MLIAEELTYSIIGASHEVYKQLGFGFREHVYVKALERELRARGHQVSREVSVVVMYKGHELTTERMDMVVDDQVVVETKCTVRLEQSASRQLYNYLRATRIEVGLLLHFGVRGVGHFRLIYSNPTSSVIRKTSLPED
ncbi:MAG TPA: GxxExxY protein [Gemmatimonadaceae bacterium]|nr:GxxExxY protein [Gemmatimonadaceae bacterium]